MYYVVQAMLDRGIYKNIEYFTYEEALEKYRSLDRSYKKLYECSLDGTRKQIAARVDWKTKFDFTLPIKDIYATPFRNMKVQKDDAYIYLLDATYHYKRHYRNNEWKLYAIYGNEKNYTPDY